MSAETLLGEMKPDFFYQSDQKLEVIQGTCRLSFVIASPNIEHKATIIRQHAENFPCKI